MYDDNFHGDDNGISTNYQNEELGLSDTKSLGQYYSMNNINSIEANDLTWTDISQSIQYGNNSMYIGKT